MKHTKIVKRGYRRDEEMPLVTHSISEVTKGLLAFFIPLGIFAAILYIAGKNTLLFGSSTNTEDFSGPHEGITIENNIAPKEYNGVYNLFYTRVTGNQVNVSSRVPYGNPKKATIDIVYQNPSKNAFLLGTEDGDGRRENIIIEHPVLDYLENNKEWTKIENEEKTMSLFQKQGAKNFTSVEEFLQKPQTEEWIQTLNTSIEQVITEGEEGKNLSYEIAFRGQTDILVAIKNTRVQFKLFYEDSNLSSGEDPIKLTLSKNNEEKKTETFPDDGEISDKGIKTGRKSILFTADVEKPGIYELNIDANSDIRLKGITTPHSFVFDKGIKLDDGTKTKTLAVLGNTFSVSTSHLKGLQTVIINENPLIIKKTGTNYSTDIPHKPLSVVIDKTDLQVTTDGIIGLTEGNIEDFGKIQPLAKTVAEFLSDTRVGIVLVNSSKTEAVNRSGWTRVRFTEENLQNIVKEKTFLFTLELPGYEKNESFKIREITVSYKK